jgi:hypothetical protein
MILSALILYAVVGLLVGALNYMVEEGDPGNESDHWLVVIRSIGIGLIWLPFTFFAVLPRREGLLPPDHPPHPSA